MPLFSKIVNLISNASPFRKVPPVVPHAGEVKAAPQTPLSFPHAPLSTTGGLLTPITTGQGKKRKRDRDSTSAAHDDPRGLLTPDSHGDARSHSPTPRSHKRARAADATPIVQSIEHDHDHPSRLPTSGATKPMNFQPVQLTPSAWKQERDEALAEVQHFREYGWREPDVNLFHKISLRGFEPVLPPHWQKDFDNLPDSLFTTKEVNATIKVHEANKSPTSNFRAAKYLWSLIDLGMEARDDILVGIRPHRRIARTFRHVLDWSLADAGLKGRQGVLPLAVVHSAPEYIPAGTLHREVNVQLAGLANQWREALAEGYRDELPPLYGIVVSHTVWAIISYEPGGKSQSPRAQDDPDNFSTLISTFSYLKPGQEVWVAFAFAIFALHCRNELVRTLEKDIVPAYDGRVRPAGQDSDA